MYQLITYCCIKINRINIKIIGQKIQKNFDFKLKKKL